MAGNFLGRSGRHGQRGSYRMMADINVTPMVDVMLVLLVVFMVTAPLLTVGVPVDLPTADIYVRGDKAINYGRVLEVMGLISGAGFTKVSLVAELPRDKGKGR
jgi:biopolymer transport protein TolR